MCTPFTVLGQITCSPPPLPSFLTTHLHMLPVWIFPEHSVRRQGIGSLSLRKMPRAMEIRLAEAEHAKVRRSVLCFSYACAFRPANRHV